MTAAALGNIRPQIQLSVNNTHIVALVDTGASRTLLRQDVFKNLCSQSSRMPILRRDNTNLQSVTGQTLEVLGFTEIAVQNAGNIQVHVVANLPNQMIIGIDALVKGDASLHLHHNCMSWFNTTWPLHLDESQGVAGLDQTCPFTTHTQINSLLAQYAKLFSGPSDPNGYCKINPMKIITTGNPIYQRPYRAPLNKRDEISKAIDDMLKAGVIKPSSSPWASPVTLVPKGEGWRFCVDYRKINQVTKRDRYPVPRIDEIFDLLQGNSVFSTLDLKNGYHQLSIDPIDTEKTAFVCHKGQFEFLRVPFGLANAPAQFQRTMDHIFRDLLGVCVLVYIDDIIVYSPDVQSHTRHLKQVFECLKQANLRLKPSKCHFAQTKVKVLGYIISGEGIVPDPAKTEAMQKLKPPTSVKQVRSFLGMANYYRSCIPDYANLAAPLTALTKQNQRFLWTEQHLSAFNSLKNALLSPQILAYPRTDLPYYLYTDASDRCVGAILVQRHEDGIEHVIQYYSHQLSDVQQRWSTLEREGYAILSAVTKLRPYLLGSLITIYTDHRPLVSLFQ